MLFAIVNLAGEMANSLYNLLMVWFVPVIMMNAYWNLGFMKDNSCTLERCPSWLLKSALNLSEKNGL